MNIFHKLVYKLYGKKPVDENFVRSALTDFYTEVNKDPLIELEFWDVASTLMKNIPNFKINVVPFNPFRNDGLNSGVSYSSKNPLVATFTIIDRADDEKSRRSVFHEGSHLLLALYNAIFKDYLFRNSRHPIIREARDSVLEDTYRQYPGKEEYMKKLEDSGFIEQFVKSLHEIMAEKLASYYLIR